MFSIHTFFHVNNNVKNLKQIKVANLTIFIVSNQVHF